MAVTSYRNPTATVSSVSVTNPDNGWSSDDAHAVFDAVNDEVLYGTFGDFSVPSGAFITGIQIVLEGKYTGTGVNRTVSVSITKNGTSFSSTKNQTIGSTSDTEYTLGADGDLWGLSGWVDTDINNNSNLQIKLRISSMSVTSIDIDSVKIRFYYDDSVLELEGFRFRDDNEDENSASWLDSQDANITRGIDINTRLRLLLNVTSNPPSQPYQLEYRKKQTGGNETVLARPFMNGRLNELAASTGKNFECVDDVSADDDTSYVENSDDANYVDYYKADLSSIPRDVIINSVKVYARIKTFTVSAGDNALIVAPNGRNYQSSGDLGLGNNSAYTNVSYQWDTNPWASRDWNRTDLDTLHFGLLLSYARATQVYIEVNYTLAYKAIPLNQGELNIVPRGEALEFDTVQGQYNTVLKYDDTHVINIWQGNAGDGYIQVFEVDTLNGELIKRSSALEFDTVDLLGASAVVFDTNKVIIFWGGSGSDGYVRTFQINTSTWAVTAWGSQLEYDITQGLFPSCAQIDSNHFLASWQGASADGFIQTFEVDLSNGNVTEYTPLEFDTVNSLYNKLLKIDGTHFINLWAGSGSDGYAQVFEVNTSTWEVTALGSNLEFDTTNGTWIEAYMFDSNKVVLINNGTGGDGYIRMLSINTSTWAVTALGTPYEFDTDTYSGGSVVALDSTHCVVFWVGTGTNGFAQVFEIDGSTGTITPASDVLQYTTDASNAYNAAVEVVDGLFAVFFTGLDTHGYCKVLTVEEDQPEIIITPSQFIAASGENTTAQLTAPSGKTTGNFSVGRIQDDENPSDAVDITNDGYTELEWCFRLSDIAQVGDIYQFRVTKGASGTELDTYSVVPELTADNPPSGDEPVDTSKFLHFFPA